MANQKSNATLHPKNLHQGRYNLQALANTLPELKNHIIINEHKIETIDFFNPKSVINLNKALLLHYYSIKGWSVPDNYLCPPIPGRADYIHHIADLLKDSQITKKVRGLDVGMGANCIYPLLGHKVYQWDFVGSEVDDKAITNAQSIIDINGIEGIELRKQSNKKFIFKGIIQPKEYFHFVLCNPPFHASAEEALKGSQRKTRNLTGKHSKTPTLNFGGKNNELWFPGGEVAFIQQMITESKAYAQNVGWFTSLVSKSKNLSIIEKSIKLIGAKESKIVEMGQGQKTSRFIAWKF